MQDHQARDKRTQSPDTALRSSLVQEKADSRWPSSGGMAAGNSETRSSYGGLSTVLGLQLKPEDRAVQLDGAEEKKDEKEEKKEGGDAEPSSAGPDEAKESAS